MATRSCLGEARYSRRADDLARFQDEPADAAIAAFLRRPDRRDAAAWLTEHDLYTLLLFARREAVRALRERDVGRARTAVHALTFVDSDQIDFRDLRVDLPLHAVRELGGDVLAEIDAAVASSPPGTARAFEAARDRAPTLSLADCLLVQVTTRYGLGFVDRWGGRLRLPPGLVDAAVSLADLIDDEGTYRTGALHTGDLPGVWFGGPHGGHVWVSGCVSFNGDHVRSAHPFSHGLLVFLAELTNPQEGDRLVRATKAASTPDRPRFGIAQGSRFALLIGGSSTKGEKSLESDDSLVRYTAPVSTVTK